MSQSSIARRMNPAIKALWLDALRSGEYEQIHGRLHQGMGFCALGVLCDLHRLATGADHWRGPDGNGNLAYLDKFCFPPRAVLDWAGLGDDRGGVMIQRDFTGLQRELGEGYHASFAVRMRAEFLAQPPELRRETLARVRRLLVDEAAREQGQPSALRRIAKDVYGL
jgi:hypothetical protein